MSDLTPEDNLPPLSTLIEKVSNHVKEYLMPINVEPKIRSIR